MSKSARLITDISELSEQHRPSAVSIGNYDGVHLGHQHVVKTLLQRSRELEVPSTIVTFEPLAKEFFAKNLTARLSSLQHRANLLFDLGVEQILSINFSQEFSEFSPDRFIQEILVDGLGIKYLCVGDDFKFGKDRAGDFDLLRKIGEERGFSVEAHETFELDDERVSSGRVRLALASGDFNLAARLLGRPYSIRGTVSAGEQLGRTLNFPTANIVLDNYIMPVSGVFAVRCRVNTSGELIKGIANIGNRPTVAGKQNRLEVHLFDFDQDIYGQTLDVELVIKVREEKKFEGLEALREQIEKDVLQAKQHFTEKLK